MIARKSLLVLALAIVACAPAEPQGVARREGAPGIGGKPEPDAPESPFQQQGLRDLHPENSLYGTVYCVALAPDGKRGIATCGDTLKLWSFPDGVLVRQFEANPNKPLAGPLTRNRYEFERTISRLAVNWQAQTAVTGNEQGELRVWDITTGKLLKRIEAYQRDNVGGLLALAISADGTHAYTSAIETVPTHGVKVWNIKTGQQTKTLGEKHDAVFRDGCIYMVPLDDRRSAIFANRQLVVRWDLTDDKLMSKFGVNDAKLICATADGSRFLTLNRQFPRLVLHGPNGQELRTLLKVGTDDEPPTQVPNAIAFSQPHGRIALSGGGDGDGGLMLWDINHPKLPVAWTSARIEAIRAIDIARDAPFAMTGSDNGIVQYWDIRAGNATWFANWVNKWQMG